MNHLSKVNCFNFLVSAISYCRLHVNIDMSIKRNHGILCQDRRIVSGRKALPPTTTGEARSVKYDFLNDCVHIICQGVGDCETLLLSLNIDMEKVESDRKRKEITIRMGMKQDCYIQ